MSAITTSLLLVLAVVLSGAIARLLPAWLPRPLVQIGFGAALGLTSVLRVELEPELFFLLFVPPLLYADGWVLPNDVLYSERRTILGLALGLVFLTVLFVGLLVHWMIPQIPIGVAFAIAAVVSPTDPIAVTAITAGTALPPRIMHLLEGESMLNDASGLVCLKLAVAAVLSGTFSLSGAMGSFAWLVAAGAAVGTAIAWAAAASGIAMSQFERGDVDVAETRVRRRVVWDMIRYTLNGTIFVLLGEQLPRAFAGAREAVVSSGHASPWWLAVHVGAIVATLAALRFGWVRVSLRRTLLRVPARAGAPARSSSRIAATMTCAGVRGALTLAGVLSLPLALADGTPLPGRDLAIFLATSVILASLVIASATLPRLVRHLELAAAPAGGRARANEARVAAARAAIYAVQRLQREPRGAGTIDRETGRRLLHEIDLREVGT